VTSKVFLVAFGSVFLSLQTNDVQLQHANQVPDLPQLAEFLIRLLKCIPATVDTPAQDTAVTSTFLSNGAVFWNEITSYCLRLCFAFCKYDHRAFLNKISLQSAHEWMVRLLFHQQPRLLNSASTFVVNLSSISADIRIALFKSLLEILSRLDETESNCASFFNLVTNMLPSIVQSTDEEAIRLQERLCECLPEKIRQCRRVETNQWQNMVLLHLFELLTRLVIEKPDTAKIIGLLECCRPISHYISSLYYSSPAFSGTKKNNIIF
jgi:hypothetical protein